MASRLLRTLLCWCSQGAFNRPHGKSLVQCAYAYSYFGCPVGKTECFFVESNHSNERRTIARLLFWSSPSAVFRRISFRAIDSVNAVRYRGFRSHIGVEVLERFPSIAYCNAVSSIVRKVFRVRVVAAVVHSLPSNVFNGGAHPVLSLSAWLAPMATITSKGRTTNDLASSAFAFTKPVRRFLNSFVTDNFLKYRPFAKSHSGQVYKVSASSIRIAVSHDSVLLKQVVVRSAERPQSLGCSHFSTFAIGGQI